MLRDGPIPAFVHGAAEYLAGVLLVVAPFVFAFESDTATVAAVAAGVVLLVVAASTRGATGLVEGIPVSVHVGLDYLLALFLVGSPYLLAFSDETAPTTLFLALGIFHLLLTIGTRFLGRHPDALADTGPDEA